jgi:nitronate monooxygenase
MTSPGSFAVRGHSLLPIVQGGMGVGVSAKRLAGAVGTIASVDLRHHHADLLEQAKHCCERDALDRLNLIALDREIRAALVIEAGNDLMKAVAEHPASCVRRARPARRPSRWAPGCRSTCRNSPKAIPTWR